MVTEVLLFRTELRKVSWRFCGLSFMGKPHLLWDGRASFGATVQTYKRFRRMRRAKRITRPRQRPSARNRAGELFARSDPGHRFRSFFRQWRPPEARRPRQK